jgi:hypothetical protein
MMNVAAAAMTGASADRSPCVINAKIPAPINGYAKVS